MSLPRLHVSKTRRQYALVDVRWKPLPTSLRYPGTAGFSLSGYGEKDGSSAIFSVYVKTLDGAPGPDKTQSAKIYAFAEKLTDRLPQIGEKFLLTTGATIAAVCVVKDRGEEEPDPRILNAEVPNH